MIQAIKDLGETVLKRENKTELSIEVQDPKVDKVIALTFSRIEGKVSFSGINDEEFDSSKVDRYLYKKGGGNGPDVSPTSKITEIKKTFNQKTKAWFKSDDLSKVENQTDKALLNGLRASLDENNELILKELCRYKNVKNAIMTIKVYEDGIGKYIGDYEVFKELFRQRIDKKNKNVAEKDKVCSVCGNRAGWVYGKIDTFKFYTLDKPGFISSGFNEEKAWRNYPVCDKCKLNLEEGKKYLTNNLSFTFQGLPYYIIPKFLIGSDDIRQKILDTFERMKNKTEHGLKDKKVIERREAQIMRTLSKEGDYLTFNFLFLRKEQSAERILLLIEDVLPSRLRTIIMASDKAEVFGDKFNFGRIKRFFHESDDGKRNNDLDRYFLEIVDKTFKGGKLDRSFILSNMMQLIRRYFLNQNKNNTDTDQFFYGVRDAISDLLFFENLEMIKWEVKTMDTNKFSDFFEKYGNAFSTPAARGIFLLGSLTKLLLEKQQKEKQSKPFMKQLKGLRMSESDIKGLLPKVQNKLEEYDSFDKGKQEIAEGASSYLLEAGNGWKLSSDELNFFFVCGMNLAGEIKNIIYNKEPNI